jgi:hypothetical protein
MRHAIFDIAWIVWARRPNPWIGAATTVVFALMVAASPVKVTGPPDAVRRAQRKKWGLVALLLVTAAIWFFFG